jgi:hypothetical protein
LTPELAKALSEEQYYQLKLVEDSNGAAPAPEILTSVPACNVRRANFRDEILLSLQDSAKALSLSYMPLISPLAPANCDEYKSLPEKLEFDTKASWEIAVPGMSVGKPKVSSDPSKPIPKIKPPPGLKWIPGASTRKSPEQGGFDEAQNAPEPGAFGFFKRYWYIILPLLVMNFMTAQAPPEAQQPQDAAAQGSAAAGAGGAAVAAASPNAGGGTPRRRGKRE